MPPASRPYRSSKRNKPCNRCRETKTRCRVVADSRCVKCLREGIQCSFADAGPSKQGSQPLDFSTPAPGSSDLEGSWAWSQSPAMSVAVGSVVPNNEQPLSSTDIEFNTQFSQSLENLRGYSAQLFGSSSECDPWLLRHCKFDDFGSRWFQNTYFRNAGGVPLVNKIPIHFMVEDTELSKSAKKETRAFDQDIATRNELNDMVPLECGQRLVALYCKHVFPMLPVISRSQLGMSSPDATLPYLTAIENCPLHLLAAIYALALRYVSDDEHLTVWHAQKAPSVDAMWRLVYEELQQAVHQAKLSVVQATLLYLHKDPSDEQRHSSSDTPFTWAWTGKLIGLATSLGLHTECSMWAIPAWEKRLRKRIWWAVYAEDKWRALLMGRPSYIHRQEWDVEDLDSSHFGASPANTLDDGDRPFISFANLSQIAESVQETFYSLRASQKLSVDMTASVQAARPLLERLEVWRTSLADRESHTAGQPGTHDTGSRSSIHFAYYILVIYVYRALFRPMVQPTTPPHIIDLEEPIIVDNPLNFDGFNWDAPGLANSTPFPTSNAVAESQTETNEDVAKAAYTCAAGIINLARHLSFRDISSFWYSWSRIGFAVASNFIVLLVVQAPNAQSAAKAKQLLDIWGQTLKEQYRACPMVRLGMLRLNSLIWAGLPETFRLPSHVEQILTRRFPASQDPTT